MTILYEKPPNWEAIKDAFDFDEAATIFTYGNAIYNPAGLPLDAPLLAHEGVHARQQKAMGAVLGPERWWRKYLKDPEWRLEQEIAAYRVQWREAQKGITDRNARAAYLRQISGILAGPTYGNLLTPAEAMRLISL